MGKEEEINDIPARKMDVSIRLTLVFLSFFSTVLALSSSARAADKPLKFPARPVRVIVPAGPGGSLGQEIRMIAPFLEKQLGVVPTVDYVTGAEGIIAYNKFYQEKPDGYTLLYFNLSSAISLELTRGAAKYTVRNFSPIAVWNVKNFVILVHPDSWKTFPEFIREAKKRNISIAGIGGSGDLQVRLLETSLKITFNLVPYESAAEAITAVAGKHVESAQTYTITPKPMIRAGKLRPLAIYSWKPDPILPGVPNLKELGFEEVPVLPGYGMFAAPSNTPKEIVTTLEKAIRNAIAVPEFNKLAETIGVVIDFKSSSELNRLTLEYYDLLNKYKQFIK